MGDASPSFQRLLSWYTEDVLPFWATRAWDDSRGGFYEALAFDGTPSVNRPRRVRVQARQIYTFTKAALAGWLPDGENIAAKGFDVFLKTACPDDGARGCAHYLDDDGTIIDDRRDLYDQAFLLLACSARWTAARDDRARALAGRTLEFLERELSSPHGGWRESDRNEFPRRQNPHMHLFEAFIAWAQASDDTRYADLAKSVRELFERVFFDPAQSVLLEFFEEDFSPAAGDAGRRIEPGHMMEWVWLLGRYDDVFNADSSAYMPPLYSNAKKLGQDTAGFLADSVVLGADPKGGRRLWPQTEYLKAAIIRARRGGIGFAKEAADLIDRLFETYFKNETAGLWCDQFNLAGQPIAKDAPASMLYHIHEAVEEVATFVKQGAAT